MSDCTATDTGLDPQHMLAVAVEAAQEAGKLLLEYRGKVKPRQKAPGDVVTRADFASQKLIRERLLGTFPDHGFVGEENLAGEEGLSGQSGEATKVRWLVDPLDGTANYVHGLDLFAVSIAAVVENNPVVGVIHAPALGQTYTAAADHGARLNGDRIHVSQVDRLEDALLVTGFPPKPQRRPELLQLYGEFCGVSHAVRRLGSAALDLAYVAAGRFDGFYAVHLHAWDCAAGVLLVQEAGGMVTKLDGSPFNLYEPDLLASNGLIHRAMIEIASRVLGFQPKT